MAEAPGDRPPALRVLGLDPGTRLLGWAVVEKDGRRMVARDHGVLRASPRSPLPERLVTLARGLRQVIRRHRPQEAAMEETFHGRDARAALRLGEGRGATLLVLAEAGLAVQGYANNVVKRSVTGAGRASKERVLLMVTRLLGLTEEPATLDASDALAVAICHLLRPPASALDKGLSPRIAAAIEAAKAQDRARGKARLQGLDLRRRGRGGRTGFLPGGSYR